MLPFISVEEAATMCQAMDSVLNVHYLCAVPERLTILCASVCVCVHVHLHLRCAGPAPDCWGTSGTEGGDGHTPGFTAKATAGPRWFPILTDG